MHAFPLLLTILISLYVDLYLFREWHGGQVGMNHILLGSSTLLAVLFAGFRTVQQLLHGPALTVTRRQGYLSALFLLLFSGCLLSMLLYLMATG